MQMIKISEVPHGETVPASIAEIVVPEDNLISAEEVQALENEVAQLDTYGVRVLQSLTDMCFLTPAIISLSAFISRKFALSHL